MTFYRCSGPSSSYKNIFFFFMRPGRYVSLIIPKENTLTNFMKFSGEVKHDTRNNWWHFRMFWITISMQKLLLFPFPRLSMTLLNLCWQDHVIKTGWADLTKSHVTLSIELVDISPNKATNISVVTNHISLLHLEIMSTWQAKSNLPNYESHNGVHVVTH